MSRTSKKKCFCAEEAVFYIGGYSHFLQQQIIDCHDAAADGYCFLSVFSLLNLLEDTLKITLNDYNSNFNVVAEKAYTQNLLSDIEYSFLSYSDNSLRKFRNCIAHKNLSAMYLQFSYEDLLYPLTEKETYKHFYDKYEEIIINLILKIMTKKEQFKICVDDLLKNNGYKIHEFSIPDLLELKGYPRDYAENIDLPQSDIIRLIDNSSDANIITALLKSVLSVDKKE